MLRSILRALKLNTPFATFIATSSGFSTLNVRFLITSFASARENIREQFKNNSAIIYTINIRNFASVDKDLNGIIEVEKGDKIGTFVGAKTYLRGKKMLAIMSTKSEDDDLDFVSEIYEKYEKQLYLIAMKYLRNHHDAQDCVHDTIKSVIEEVEKFKKANDQGYLERFITVSCRNCALNVLRSKKYRSEHEKDFGKLNCDGFESDNIDILDYGSCVDKIYISEENCEYLKGLINKLDDKYRDVIIFKSLGIDYQGIAVKMNISEALVRKRYERAKSIYT